MAGFSLTNKARSDLKEIARFTQARWGREQRVRYLALLDACFQQLSANPHIGKNRSDVRSGYRAYPVGSHLIFYRQGSCEIEIIRILHQSMDAEDRLAEP